CSNTSANSLDTTTTSPRTPQSAACVLPLMKPRNTPVTPMYPDAKKEDVADTHKSNALTAAKHTQPTTNNALSVGTSCKHTKQKEPPLIHQTTAWKRRRKNINARQTLPTMPSGAGAQLRQIISCHAINS